MSEKRKYRHELKYTITKRDAEILKQRLALLMDIDSNGENGYFIRAYILIHHILVHTMRNWMVFYIEKNIEYVFIITIIVL